MSSGFRDALPDSRIRALGLGEQCLDRAVVEALCRIGQTVHVVCQEQRPERHDFVAAAYQYEPDGKRETLFERKTSYAGRAILHRPRLDLLPVYVRPTADVTYMASILDLSEDQIQTYLDRNERALLRIVRENGVSAMHVNHCVLMSVVAHRVSQATGVPYAVMPHGSALEYVVRQDARMQAMARDAMDGAARILVLSDELAQRLPEVLPNIRDFDRKLSRTNVGVDSGELRLALEASEERASEDSRRRLPDRSAASGPNTWNCCRRPCVMIFR